MKRFDRPSRKIPTVRSGLAIRTVAEMLETSAEKYGDKVAYLIPRDNIIHNFSYAQVFHQVKLIARHLKELGLGKGDHIAVLGENRPEWAISYFAVAWIGAVAIPLDGRASLDSWKFIIQFSSAKAIFLSNSFLSDIQSVSGELDELKHIIVMENFDQVFKRYSAGVNMENVSPDDLLQILFTSGTTGDPKGVMLSHKNAMSNVDDIYRTIGLTPEDRMFSVLPIHHSYECTGGMLTPFYNGMSVFYARSLKPNEMTEDLRNAEPTIWLNSPLILEKLYRRIDRELSNQVGFKRLITKALPKKSIGNKVKRRLGLEKIKLIVCGGAALPAWVSKGLGELGFPIIQGYG
ncbi:MAG: AMP-binding protein, partial [Thermodesulfobacteriota bacterium]